MRKSFFLRPFALLAAAASLAFSGAPRQGVHTLENREGANAIPHGKRISRDRRFPQTVKFRNRAHRARVQGAFAYLA